MTKKRRRFRHNTSLAERLAAQAAHLRDRARTLAPGTEQTELWQKLEQTETALRIDRWLTGSQASSADLVASTGKRSNKRNSSKSSHG